MLWWGRIGKLVALVAAFAIIAEFAGPVRMRVWGQSLHRVVSVRPLMSRLISAYLWFFWACARWPAAIFLFWLPAARPLIERFGDNSMRHLRDAGVLGRWWRYSIVAVSLITLVLLVLIPLAIFLSFSFEALITIVVVLALTVYFGVFLVFGAPLAFVIALSALNALILEPFAWLMERGETRIKISSFGLFLLAAHFDLLAS